MLNKEKYATEIIDIVCNEGAVALRNGHLYSCTKITCQECDLNYGYNCHKNFMEWANSEYKEHEIDWNKVPVDTPVYVWDEDYNDKIPRHFARFEDNTIGTFDSGQTSWTVDSKYDISYWRNAEIKEGIDCSQWYKD